MFIKGSLKKNVILYSFDSLDRVLSEFIILSIIDLFCGMSNVFISISWYASHEGVFVNSAYSLIYHGRPINSVAKIYIGKFWDKYSSELNENFIIRLRILIEVSLVYDDSTSKNLVVNFSHVKSNIPDVSTLLWKKSKYLSIIDYLFESDYVYIISKGGLHVKPYYGSITFIWLLFTLIYQFFTPDRLKILYIESS